MSEHEQAHPIGAYLIVIVLTAAIIGIFSFLGGGVQQYWPAAVVFVLWGFASLVIFTRPDRSSH